MSEIYDLTVKICIEKYVKNITNVPLEKRLKLANVPYSVLIKNLKNEGIKINKQISEKLVHTYFLEPPVSNLTSYTSLTNKNIKSGDDETNEIVGFHLKNNSGLELTISEYTIDGKNILETIFGIECEIKLEEVNNFQILDSIKKALEKTYDELI